MQTAYLPAAPKLRFMVRGSVLTLAGLVAIHDQHVVLVPGTLVPGLRPGDLGACSECPDDQPIQQAELQIISQKVADGEEIVFQDAVCLDCLPVFVDTLLVAGRELVEVRGAGFAKEES